MTAADDVRDWVGSDPDDDGVFDALDRFDGAPLPAARSILRRRRADLLREVHRLDVDGDYSETAHDLRAQVAVIDADLDRLDRLIGDDTGAGPPLLTSAPIEGPKGIR